MRLTRTASRNNLLAASLLGALTAVPAAFAASAPKQIECQSQHGGFPHIFLNLDRSPAELTLAESYTNPFLNMPVPVDTVVGPAGTRLAGQTLYTMVVATDKTVKIYLNTVPLVRDTAPFAGVGSIGNPDEKGLETLLQCNGW